MRIHKLALTAYGPFPGRVDIDFEELNDAGIFLLNGPTGSGKSSILDAICFALYGTTSLARPDLKSHFAAEEVEPNVELECTVGSAHLRISRTPKWMRPKKRGTGYLLEHAKVLIEREDPEHPGVWETKATRNDEAGQYITELMGLSREQFTQVMLLPQGEFARFLTSKSADREELLKRLFPTDTFERVQAELHRRARESLLKAESALADVAKIEDRLEQTVERSGVDDVRNNFANQLGFLNEATRAELLAGLEGTSENVDSELASEQIPETTATPQSEEPDLSVRLSLTENILDRNQAALIQASALSQEATDKKRQEVQRVQEEIRQWALFHQLTQQRAILVEQEPQHLQRIERTEDAQVALQIIPLIDAEERAQHQAHQSDSSLQRITQQLAQAAEQSIWLTLPEAHDVASGVSVFTKDTAQHQDVKLVHQVRNKLAEHISETESLVQREKIAHELSKDIARLTQELAQHTQQLERTHQQARETEERIKVLDEKIQQDQRPDLELAEFAGTLKNVRQKVELSEKLLAVQKQIDTAAIAAQQAEEQRRRAADRAEELFTTRFAQAAQGLALMLEDSQPCPVCGSIEHPSPAVVEQEEQLIDDAAVELAREQRNQAEQRSHNAHEKLIQAQASSESLKEAGAEDIELAREQLATATAHHHVLRQRVDELEKTRVELSMWTKRQQDIAEKLQTTDVMIAQISSQKTVFCDQLAEHQRVLSVTSSEQSLSEQLQEQKKLHQLLEHLENGKIEVQRTQQQFQEHSERLRQTLKEAQIQSKDQVLKNYLAPQELQHLKESINTYRRTESGLEARLNEPALQKISEIHSSGGEAPSEENLTQAQEQLTLHRQRDEQFLRWETQLSRALQDIRQLQTDHQRISDRNDALVETARMQARMADIAAGNTADNQLAMSLTTYVLAAQLEEVAQASTLHLEKMTHGRYKLQYTDEKQNRGKSGLGIAIFDTWHAKQRVPATLSGGETFMASLSLALGLADVVQQRNGGIEIDTLFVDEGFGTLDESTLEEVMGTLEDLRSGGRVIGLISHVSEMKNRIPLHITLATSPEGSTLVSPTS